MSGHLGNSIIVTSLPRDQKPRIHWDGISLYLDGKSSGRYVNAANEPDVIGLEPGVM